MSALNSIWLLDMQIVVIFFEVPLFDNEFYIIMVNFQLDQFIGLEKLQNLD